MTNTLKGLFVRGKNKRVIDSVKVVHSFWGKFKGLMGSRIEDFNFALIFSWDRPSQVDRSLHMLFVSYPIMALFLDAHCRVIDQVTLYPWQLNYTPKRPCQFIVELPITNGKLVKIGDVLDWEKE